VNGPDLVIFSDLDGCLLDAETYAWEPARPALELLRRRGIPLVLCSSKTRAEMEVHREEFGLGGPFIVENGGAVLIPEGYFPSAPGSRDPRDPYRRLPLGAAYARLTEALADIQGATGLRLRGFGEMSAEEVSRLTGLALEAARRAKAREYDEPFLADLRPDQVERLEAEVMRRGLALTRAGRFYHLSGRHDKGVAVDVLARLFRDRFPHVRTVGLGDGANDLPMLARVDLPVIIPRGPAQVDPALADRPWRVAPAAGPAGWGAAVQEIVGGPVPAVGAP